MANAIDFDAFDNHVDKMSIVSFAKTIDLDAFERHVKKKCRSFRWPKCSFSMLRTSC